MGIRSRATMSIQAPNTVGINRARAAQDVSGQNTGGNGAQVT
jgi:hypothetical protein